MALRLCGVVFLLALIYAPPLYAQGDTTGDVAANAKIHFGPLAMTPTLSLTNLGVDTNVFNQPASEGPKKDFTMTVEPKTDLWLRFGRTWLTGNLTEDLVYYQKYRQPARVQ